jgi:phage head maturation protease
MIQGFDPGEVFTRNDAELADVDVKQRLIDLVAVPWDEAAAVDWRGDMWQEVFRRGAFDGLEEHVERVRVNREHVIGDTVGRLVWADPKAESGLIVRAKIARSQRGDDTLALAEDDAISASVGYRIKSPTDITLTHRDRLREVFRAFLDHLGMVESPTWETAKVLAVREKSKVVESTPIDEAWAHPAYLAAVARLENVE